MNAREMIEAVIRQRGQQGGIQQVYLVACGGSLVDMYPAKYFLDSESSMLRSGMVTANEFVHVPPRALGKNSLVIVCSHGGNTAESVAAAALAQQRGAQTITLSHNPQARLIQYGDHHISYVWGTETSVTENPITLILSLCVEVLHQSEGYPHYEDFLRAMAQIDAVIAAARTLVAPCCEDFAERYQSESLFYVLSSGASFGQAYGVAICSLMEMQWLHAAAIHSGEYFHGPFEVTDRQTPFILLMNEGRTRPLDERVSDFLSRYAEKIEVVDARALGIGVLPETVVEFFNPVLFYRIMCEYRGALALIRNHPLETRRYMNKVAY
ncbi:SIS domain-containing protein [Brenneria rubrifaciens]|uniref:SIS domain-containing protein n=1 Tax=Brenneria rubrifaciens TaxID=55213 RepID=A0A4P8QN81_9GAMM|nr:SIS domain-containing protein [Brenneria rubrifaciens]QCR08421.1 SIS domain-containing protein [Brenneria rubrifaciens]